jgi:hypothetical protein
MANETLEGKDTLEGEDTILGEDDVEVVEGGDVVEEDVFEEDFGDVFEETLLPNGEHELVILKMHIEKSKSTEGRKMLHVVFESTQDDKARELHDYMLFENAALGDSPKQINRRKLRRQHFYQAFGIDPSAGVSCTEAAGLTGYAVITTQDDAKFGKQNRIKDYSVGA